MNPPPLAPVTLRGNVRDYCWMLLGPPPEKWEAFYANVINPPPNPYLKPAEPEPMPAKKPRTKKGKA